MRSLPKWVAGAVLVLASSTLLAQPAPAPTPAPDEGATVPSEQQAKLSPAEMQAQARTYDEQNKEHARHVEQLRMTARKQKDVIKLNCVNDKYLQIKALLNIMDAALANLEVAILGKDDDGRYHEFTKITITSEKVRALRDEADACVGEELTYLGETAVEVHEPKIPDDPTRDDPFGNDIEPPGYASPFD